MKKARAAVDKMSQYRKEQAEKANKAAIEAAKKQEEALQLELRLMREINLENAKKEAAAKAELALQNDVYQFNEDVYQMEQWLASAREMQKTQTEAATQALQAQMEVAYSLQNAFAVIGATIASAFDTGNKALDAFLSALTQIGLQVIAKNLAISMSSAIKGAAEASAATGPAAPITLPAFIAAMTGVVATSFAGLTKMAHGGIVNKATPLIAGEAGPEAIIPLNQLNRMGGNLSARISGRDLLLLLEREQTVKARGYGQ